MSVYVFVASSTSQTHLGVVRGESAQGVSNDVALNIAREDFIA
jgi:hypothetical protein